MKLFHHFTSEFDVHWLTNFSQNKRRTSREDAAISSFGQFSVWKYEKEAIYPKSVQIDVPFVHPSCQDKANIDIF